MADSRSSALYNVLLVSMILFSGLWYGQGNCGASRLSVDRYDHLQEDALRKKASRLSKK